MNNFLLIIILIWYQIIINIAFTSSNALLHAGERHKKSKGLSYLSDGSSQRFRRDSPLIPQQLISVPGYRMNNDNSASSSSVFCPINPPSYPLKSIVISNTGSINGATLNLPNQPSFNVKTAETRGPFLIFNDLPISQCYSLNFSSQTSRVNPIDMNNMKVQFIYDTSNAARGETTSTGSETSSSLPPTRNTNTPCGSIICGNGGICRYMGPNRYQCQCDSSKQWLGTDCSKPNPCIRTPCNNRGQCYYRPDATYYCVCNSGYSGNNCQFSATTTTTTAASYNPCLSTRPCLNGGTCQQKGVRGEFTCVCRQGYIGDKCQTLNHLTATTTAATSLNSCGICNIKRSIQFGDRIINGDPVTTYVWPWIVSLQTRGSHFCGGVLIDAYHVVTAAHCFETSSISPNTYKVVAGLLNLQQTHVPNVQQFSIDRIFRHEHYSSTKLVNDIAVIKLRTPARFYSAVSPICLPNSNSAQDPKVGETVEIAGWGYTNSVTKQLAPQLQEAYIQILNINGDLYGGPGCNVWTHRGYSLNNAQQICAMSRDTRTDSCQGDSGGPLIRDINSKWYLFGIVSYGDAVCASGKAAGVYTRVSAYTTWIQQKLKL